MYTTARFLSADCEARGLREETLRKYRLMERGLLEEFGSRPLDAVGIDELSRYREKWTLAPGTARTKIGDSPALLPALRGAGMD